MRSFFIATLFCATVLSAIKAQTQAPSYKSVPVKARGTFSAINVPLLGPDRIFWIREVPVILYGTFPSSLVEVLQQPVFAVSANPADRKKDLNIISQCRIKLAFVPGEAERGDILTIDLAEYRPPEPSMPVENVVQAIMTCLRLSLSPIFSDNVYVEISGGVAKDDTIQRMSGPLWFPK